MNDFLDTMQEKAKDEFDYVQFSRTRIIPVIRFWLDKGYTIRDLADNLSIVAEETGDKEASFILDRCWEMD